MTSSEPRPAPGDEDYCYLTTTGRVTGRPHRIEIWFALEGSIVYLLAGGRMRADWVSNLVASPEVTLELAGRQYCARARVILDEDDARPARQLLYEKYSRRYQGSLEDWRDQALLVAVELHERP